MRGTIPTSVGIEDCGTLRKAAKEGLSARAAVETHELDIHPGTARTHASGDCACETDEAPHPFRSWERQIGADDCSRLRALVNDGLSVPNAVDELGLSGTTGAAGYHVRGDCDCETDVPPRPAGATEMDADDCAALRRVADRGVSSTAAVADLELDVTPGRARDHARGTCSCDTDVPPVAFDATRRVTSEACGELRELADRGLTASAAIERVGLPVHPETARTHAKGDCTCETTVPATPFAASRGNVTPSDCGELRRLARDGLSPTAAIDAIGLDVQPATARHHATADCTCSTDVRGEPFAAQQRGISAATCGELRRCASDGWSAPAAIDALGLDSTPTTARIHARGDCTCETDVPDTPFDSRRVSGADCRAFRRLAASGYSAREAVEALGLDVDPETARYHARATCSCDTDVPAHSFSGRRVAVSASDCAELRRMAREGRSAQAALDSLDLDVTTKTAGTHAGGDCTCDVDVQPHSFGAWSPLSADDCAGLRRRAADGMTATDAIDDLGLDVGRSTACRHARGDCTCDAAVSPTSFGSGPAISDEDCGALRRLAAEGSSGPAAVDELGLDVNPVNVYRHARGVCTCDTDVPAHRFQSRGPRTVSPQECADIRRQLQAGVTKSDVETTHSVATVRTHGTGDCTHEIDVPAIQTETDAVTFTSEMCTLSERLYYEAHRHTGQIKAEIDERFGVDVDESTIKYHLVEDCDHPP